jgi:hypothetical protein
MLPNPAWEVGGHADIERAVRAAGHDVDISAFCQIILPTHRRPGVGWGPSRGEGSHSDCRLARKSLITLPRQRRAKTSAVIAKLRLRFSWSKTEHETMISSACVRA